MNRFRSYFAVVTLALFASGPAAAESAPKRPKAERYEVATPLSDVKAGAAKVKVSAPLSVVREVVTDYGGYDEHIRKFQKAHVIGKQGDKTDVYLQVPILKGVSKVWAIVRFEPAKKISDTEEVIEGRMIKGNVKKLNAWWRLKKLDEQNTQLNLELLIVPDLPVPGSLITDEAASAADKAVVGLRKRSETVKK